MTFFTELWQRLRAHTPPFFKRLMVFFGSVAALGGTLAGAQALGITLPSWFNPDWPGNLFVAGSVGTFLCKLPVNWNATSPNDVPDVPAPAAVQVVKEEFDLPPDEAPAS